MKPVRSLLAAGTVSGAAGGVQNTITAQRAVVIL
jgi:hypothetical protein